MSWKVVTASESGPKEAVVCQRGEEPPVLPVGWGEVHRPRERPNGTSAQLAPRGHVQVQCGQKPEGE